MSSAGLGNRLRACLRSAGTWPARSEEAGLPFVWDGEDADDGLRIRRNEMELLSVYRIRSPPQHAQVRRPAQQKASRLRHRRCRSPPSAAGWEWTVIVFSQTRLSVTLVPDSLEYWMSADSANPTGERGSVYPRAFMN
jgi:hypothetical protein